MGICESTNNDKKEKNENKEEPKLLSIESSLISDYKTNTPIKKKLFSSEIKTNNKSLDHIVNSNNCPKLEKYERSLARKSETSQNFQTISEFSSKKSEGEIIIRGEINKECPNKEKDFNNNSFKKLVKNKGGIILKEDAQSNSKNNNKINQNLIFNGIGNENISEIKSQNSYQTNPKSLNSEFSLINGKKNKNDNQSEFKKSQFTNHTMNQMKYNNKTFNRNDKKSHYSCKTINPKLSIKNYLNGVFNTELEGNNIYNNRYKFIKINSLNLNHQNINSRIYNNQHFNMNFYQKDSVVSNINNMTNESTNEDLMGSFISIPKNDETIPEYDLKEEDIISNISSEK